MRTHLLALALTAAALVGCDSTQKSDPAVTPKPVITRTGDNLLTITQVATKEKKTLKVSSPAFKDNGEIPEMYSDLGQKISPELHIGNVPAAAKSFVVLMEDPDAAEPKPFIHWVLYNVPVGATTIRKGLSNNLRLLDLDRALQGPSSYGNIGYYGPHPPAKDPAHHYHFQVFALDTLLPLDPGAKHAEVVKAMKGHVLATGQLTGLFDNNEK